MALINNSNTSSKSSEVLKKWDPISLYIVALGLMGESMQAFLNGWTMSVSMLAASLILLYVDYSIADRLVKIFELRNCSTTLISLSKFNVKAVVIVGLLSILDSFSNHLGEEVSALLALIELCAVVGLYLTQMYIAFKLIGMGTTTLGLSILAYIIATFVSIGIYMGLEGNRSDEGFRVCLGGIMVIVGVIMYWQYNKFFIEDDEKRLKAY